MYTLSWNPKWQNEHPWHVYNVVDRTDFLWLTTSWRMFLCGHGCRLAHRYHHGSSNYCLCSCRCSFKLPLSNVRAPIKFAPAEYLPFAGRASRGIRLYDAYFHVSNEFQSSALLLHEYCVYDKILRNRRQFPWLGRVIKRNENSIFSIQTRTLRKSLFPYSTRITNNAWPWYFITFVLVQ